MRPFIQRLLVLLALAAPLSALAQSGPRGNTLAPDTVALLQAQERQLSRFSQEVFSRYLQVAYDRDLLEREGTTYTVKGSLFALGGIVRSDFNELSTQQGTRFGRSFAVEAGAKAGNQFKLSDGIIGFNWALIDHRNPLFYREDDAIEIRNQLAANRSGRKAQADFESAVATVRVKQGDVAADAMAKERTDAIDPNLQPTPAARQKALQAVYDKYNIKTGEKYTIETVTESLKNRSLFTIYGRAYTDFEKLIPTQSEIGLQYLRGIGTSADDQNRWQFDIKAFLALRPDSTLVGRNLRRSSLIAKAGVNRVLIMAADGKQSFLEAKFDLGNEYRTGTVFPTEDKNTFYGEAALRVRVSQQFWVPLTIKYDANDGTVLGFLKVIWNISPLSSDTPSTQ